MIILKIENIYGTKYTILKTEKNSRLAREIIIGLPNEFNAKENIELAKEFSETLSNEGMIVDLNIHKINDENPHAHLLCTVRGFDENGNFEPKRIGNKRVRDWDTDEKHNEWRKTLGNCSK
ncbi:MobA/MobL family protein [Staphylococcus aureus]|uniref:MobA/MobL family protein n=1 Tax=Staphylococcus aureus TaxID=1280 RepID=UPI00344FBFE9